MLITLISIIIDSINERFPCTHRSAQKNFHAAMNSRLTTNVKRTKDMMKSFNRSTAIAPGTQKF